jgi:hypothetical protein
VAVAEIRPGDPIVRGILYRWISNTILSYDYSSKKANKMAFRPDKGESGISVFRADLVLPADVIYGLEGYGVCEFRAEAFLEEVRRLRADPKNDFDEEVTIKFEPNSVPRKGHGHCYIDPMPTLIQKALYRRLTKMVEGFLPAPAVAGRQAYQE